MSSIELISDLLNSKMIFSLLVLFIVWSICQYSIVPFIKYNKKEVMLQNKILEEKIEDNQKSKVHSHHQLVNIVKELDEQINILEKKAEDTVQGKKHQQQTCINRKISINTKKIIDSINKKFD